MFPGIDSAGVSGGSGLPWDLPLPISPTRAGATEETHYEIAETHMRYGYRYCLEGLQMRLKPPRRRVTAKLRDDRSDATGPNQVWAMDWMYDELFDGRRLWVLTVVDASTYCCGVKAGT